MGSPLAPPLANLFMGVNENKWLREYNENGPTFYKRYVDDIFAVFDSETKCNSFFAYINKLHPNLRFTVEYPSGTLPFLDVEVTRNALFFASNVCSDLSILTEEV